MVHVPAQVAASVLTIVFTWSAGAKLVRWRTWREIVARYRLPRGMDAVSVVGVPTVEGMVPILFLAGASRAAAALTLALLAMFSLAVLRARRLQGDRLPCGCFGKTTTRDYRVTIVRNAALAVAAALVTLAGRDVALLEGVGAPSGSEIVAVFLTGTGVALVAWMLWSLRASLRGDR